MATFLIGLWLLTLSVTQYLEEDIRGLAYAEALVLTLLASEGVWLFVRRALRPLDELTDAIRLMAANDAGLRALPVAGDQEIRDLAQSFNALVDQRTRAETALRQSEERLTLAELASKSGHWELDLNSRTVTASLGASRIYGVDGSRQDLALVQRAALPEYRPILDAALKSLIEQNKHYDVRYKIRAADTGETKDIHSIALFDTVRQVVFGVIQDVSEQRRMEEKQRLAATVFSHAREGILITDAEGTILDLNQTFSDLTGYCREEVVGKNPRMLRSGRQDARFYEGMWRNIAEKHYWHGEIWNRRKGGEIFPAMVTISAVRDPQGKALQYVALFTDITAIKDHEDRLELMAHCDPLTGLPNRSLLSDRLQQAMALANRHGRRIAVCYLDLDGFKPVNDRHGHEVGDQLLITLGKRMKQTLRESDTLARIGGDEFVAVLLDQSDEHAYLATVERLIQTVSRPVRLGDFDIQVSASLGITFYPQEAPVDTNHLLRQADHAMYEAKSAGRNRFRMFEKVSERA